MVTAIAKFILLANPEECPSHLCNMVSKNDILFQKAFADSDDEEQNLFPELLSIHTTFTLIQSFGSFAFHQLLKDDFAGKPEVDGKTPTSSATPTATPAVSTSPSIVSNSASIATTTAIVTSESPAHKQAEQQDINVEVTPADATSGTIRKRDPNDDLDPGRTGNGPRQAFPQSSQASLQYSLSGQDLSPYTTFGAAPLDESGEFERKHDTE